MKKLREKLAASFRTKSWRAGAYSVFAAVIVAAMAVVANLAVGALPATATQLDMTDEQLYTLSQGTEQALAALDKDVEIYWLVQPGNENTTMEQVLLRYAQFDRVTVTSVDPVRYPGFAAEYTDETVTENSLIVASGDRSMYIPYDSVWTYSDYEMYSYYLTYYGSEYLDVFAGEGKITGAIGYVTGGDLPILYYLTGHGETGVSDDVLDAMALENVQAESLNLLTAEAVPDDCAVLALFGPVSDLTAREAAMVEEYLAGGGQLLVTTAYTAADMPHLKALLDGFGLELLDGCVMEDDSRYYSYGYIDLLLPQIGSHDITAPLREGGYSVLMPDSQGMVLAEHIPADITVTPLLESSLTSYLKEGLEGLTGYERADGDRTGSFILAAAAENETTGARLAVFGSTRFMEADFSDMVSGAGMDLFLNGVNWLSRQEQGISIHPKILTGDYLTFDESAAGVLKVALTSVIPALFLAAGLVIYMRRRRR